MSEYVNILVICMVSLPAYVNVAHLHLSVGEFSFRFCVRLGFFFVDGLGRNYYRGYYGLCLLPGGVFHCVTGMCLVCCIGILLWHIFVMWGSWMCKG